MLAGLRLIFGTGILKPAFELVFRFTLGKDDRRPLVKVDGEIKRDLTGDGSGRSSLLLLLGKLGEFLRIKRGEDPRELAPDAMSEDEMSLGRVMCESTFS